MSDLQYKSLINKDRQQHKFLNTSFWRTKDVIHFRFLSMICNGFFDHRLQKMTTYFLIRKSTAQHKI
jgi:hypothetical protein